MPTYLSVATRNVITGMTSWKSVLDGETAAACKLFYISAYTLPWQCADPAANLARVHSTLVPFGSSRRLLGEMKSPCSQGRIQA